MRAELTKQLKFPSQITTSLKPDVVLVVSIKMCVLITELTIQWEEDIQEVYKRTKLQYANLL